MLIGADGISSAVRRQLHPGEGPLIWNGIRMWRGIAEADPYLTGRSMIVAGSHRGGRLVIYPISKAAEDRGRAMLNWVAEVGVTPETRIATDTADWTREGRLEDVLPYYADWSFGWLDVPRLIADSAQILEYHRRPPAGHGGRTRPGRLRRHRGRAHGGGADEPEGGGFRRTTDVDVEALNSRLSWDPTRRIPPWA